jgi:hypothetical protein
MDHSGKKYETRDSVLVFVFSVATFILFSVIFRSSYDSKINKKGDQEKTMVVCHFSFNESVSHSNNNC